MTCSRKFTESGSPTPLHHDYSVVSSVLTVSPSAFAFHIGSAMASFGAGESSYSGQGWFIKNDRPQQVSIYALAASRKVILFGVLCPRNLHPNLQV